MHFNQQETGQYPILFIFLVVLFMFITFNRRITKDSPCLLSLHFKISVLADDHFYNDRGENSGDVSDYNYSFGADDVVNGNGDGKAQNDNLKMLTKIMILIIIMKMVITSNSTK